MRWYGPAAGAHSRRRPRPKLGASCVLVALGLALALAPGVTDLVSRIGAEQQTSYAQGQWSAVGPERAARLWRQARAYNRVLVGKAAKGVKRVLPYSEQLSYADWPYVCWLEVKSVGISLGVYHGTEDQALSSGAGHVETSSLPVGGKGANCCVAAHSGATMSTMFDSLRDVERGDYVLVTTLGRELGYEVVGKEIVDPGDTSLLEPQEGRDLLTLVTCTSDPVPGMPWGGYGVNDKRLVVTCERCPVREEAAPAAVSLPNSRWWPAALAGIVLAAVLACGALTARKAGKTDKRKAPVGRHSRTDGQRGLAPYRIRRIRP